jgi:DHA2 family multidrug resistance protein
MDGTEATEKKSSDALPWLILATVIVGTFLGRLDQTIVNLALPKIIEDFGISVSASGWIATAYILANAVFVPIWGKLGDTIGRKKVYITGFIIFIFGSVLAGLSWNLSSMIVFRIIQAIASSADYPTAMAILTVTFVDMKKRGQALGIWSSAFAAAAVFGPLIGGPLIDNFGWRSIFLLNLPVGLIGLAMALLFVKESVSGRKNVKFDWWGAVTLGGALAALSLVLDQGQSWGWLSFNSVITYIATIVCTILFIVIEKKVAEPIVDFKFFKIPAFVYTVINNFIVFMGMMGSVFLIPVFAETFLNYTATQAGYLFMPMAAALVLASPIGGSLIGKVKAKYVIFASTLVAALGLWMFSWYLDILSTPWDIIFPLFIMAFGLGFGMAQRTNIVASVVPAEEIGVASSILALARNISGAFGVSIFATLLTNFSESNVINISKWSVIHSINPAIIQEFIALVEIKGQVDAYATVFIIAAVIVLIGAFLSLLINVPHERHDVKVHVE